MRRIGAAVLMVLALGSSRCSDPQSFEDVQRRIEPFIDFRNVTVLGQDRQVFARDVPGEAVHPHFEGRWTVRDPERPVDVYVFRAGEYNPTQPLADQNYYWASTTNTLGVGQARSNELHLHPSPGGWVLVFFNPGVNPQGARTDLSAEITFTYFR